MNKQPSNLHPEVFVEVWKKWSELCIKHEKKGALTKDTRDKLWEVSVKIVDYNIRLDWASFCRRHMLGVFK